MNNRYLYPKNWESLRVIILVRDGYTCTICKRHQNLIVSKKGNPVSLHVMHLDGNTFNNCYTLDEFIFGNEKNNLASGCPECHRLYDRRNGYNKKYRKKNNYQVIDLSLNTNKK